MGKPFNLRRSIIIAAIAAGFATAAGGGAIGGGAAVSNTGHGPTQDVVEQFRREDEREREQERERNRPFGHFGESHGVAWPAIP